MTTNPHRYPLITFIQLVDLAVIAFGFALAVIAELRPEPSLSVLELRITVGNVLFLVAFLASCHLVMRTVGLYRSHRLTSITREWSDLAWVVLVATITLFAAGRLMQFEYATRSFPPTFALITFIALALERRGFRFLARAVRRHGHNIRNVIVVGRDENGFDLASRLVRRGDLGYAVEAVIEVKSRDGGEALEKVTALLESRPIDEVFITLPLDAHQALIRDVVSICEEQGVTIRVLSGLVDLIVARAQLDEIDGRPVVTIFSGPPDSLLLAVKRLIDVTVSGLALLLLSPIGLLIALAIKLDSRGPVFFVQERVGLGGRRFRFFKFRTMVPDAEQRQSALENLNEATGPVFKIRNDPRITRVGRILRQFSLDELPQFINVLHGDMSLVGPRPLPVRDVLRIDRRAHKRRFSVRPGITCLWQVFGREPSFEEWIRTDMEYIDNWSLRLDFEILAKTIPAVITGRGAY
ncbi:MAG TPA: sugar transferase [Candidatus Binatia bacterium]|nr:sugar transferase [Candidatus Binatia bacterium]